MAKVWLIFACLAVVACSNTKVETDSGSPTPTPGTDLPSSSHPNGQIPPQVQWAVPLQLADSTQYSGLTDLAGVVAPPLVGDPLVYISLPKDRATVMSQSKFFFSFEDAIGFWGAEVDLFYGERSNQGFQAIYSDADFVIYTILSFQSGSSEEMYGWTYYRKRLSGENQCKKWVCSGPNCQVPDSISPCIQYMATSNASVKLLGTFRAKYSQWAK